jgi:hypothetical protein
MDRDEENRENGMELRKVTIYRYDRNVDGHGLFHAWGVDYEEFEGGLASYSTAIVEMPDGSVRSVPVEMIKFDN